MNPINNLRCCVSIRNFYYDNVSYSEGDQNSSGKNWKDVLRYSGKKESDILPWKNPKNKQQVSQNAFAKIQVISEVLNEGWSPNFKDLRENKTINKVPFHISLDNSLKDIVIGRAGIFDNFTITFEQMYKRVSLKYNPKKVYER